MVKWLAIGAAISLAWTNAASAQLNGFTPGEIAGAHHVRARDFRMAGVAPLGGPHQFTSDMIVSRDLGPNATLGLGLAKVAGRKQGTTDFRISGSPTRRKPGVTFLLHF